MKSFEERLLSRLYCFCTGGNDNDNGGGDDRPTTSPAQRGGLSSSAARDTSRDAERDRDIGSIGDGSGNEDSGDRNLIAQKANVPVDTIVGSGPDGSRAVTDKDGNPVTSSRSVSEAAREQGVSESEIRDRINSATSELQQAEEAREYSFDDADDPTIPVEFTDQAIIDADDPTIPVSESVYSFDDPLVSEDFVESIRSMGTSPETLAREQEILDQTQRNIDELTGSRPPDRTSYTVDPSINRLTPQEIERTLYGTTLATSTGPARNEYFDENIRDPRRSDAKISEQDYLNLQRGRDIIEGAEIADIGMPGTLSDDFDPGFFDDDTGDTGSGRAPSGGTEIRSGDVDPSEFEDTFVSQDRIGAGVPVSTLPEGSYQIDAATNTVSLNEAGKSYMDELAKGYRNEPNEFGIDRQEIDSLIQQGQVVGAPMVQISTEDVGVDGSTEGAEAKAGEGEDEAGLPGGSGGDGRLGDDKVAQEGVEDFAYDYPAFFPSETGDQAQQEQSTSGIGLSPDSGGVGLLPGEGGIIGTDSGIVGQSGSGGLNPFTEGGEGGEGDETSDILGQGEGQAGTGEGAGDGTGTGTPPDLVSGEGGDDGFEPSPPVQTDPYDFGSGEYDPLLDFEYRQPQITSPFDFARDFGSYTLSPEIEQRFQDLTADRLAQGFEPAALYEPEFLEQIGIMSPERQAEEGIASLIGSRFPQSTPDGERYPFDSTPEESAQSIVDSLLAGE